MGASGGRRRRALLLNLVLAFVSAAVAVKAVDLMLGVQQRARADRFSQPKNAQHFRASYDYAPEPAPTVRARVAAIGDSFTFGWGVTVEQAYPAQLERALEASGKLGDVEVMNFGIWGAESAQEARVLESVLRDYRPDLVLWQVYVNDIGEIDLFALSDGAVSSAVDEESARGQHVLAYAAKEAFVRFAPNVYGVLGSFLRRTYGRLLDYRRTVHNDPDYTYQQYGALYPEAQLVGLPERWRAFESVIARAHAQTRAADGEFVLIVVPAAIEIGDYYRRQIETDELTHVEPDVATGRHMHTRIREMCAARGLVCLHLLDALQAADAQGRTFLDHDYHLTEYGTSVVVGEIRPTVARLLALKGRGAP